MYLQVAERGEIRYGGEIREMDSKVIGNIDFKKNAGVARRLHPMVRFILDGVLFLLICISILVSFTLIKHSMSRRGYKIAAEHGAVKKLMASRPAVAQFAEEHDGNIVLLFLDFECVRCAKAWRDIHEYLPAASQRYGIALVLSRTSIKDPVYNIIYDGDRGISADFGISAEPSMVVIDGGEVANVIDTNGGIVDWFRGNGGAGRQGPGEEVKSPGLFSK